MIVKIPPRVDSILQILTQSGFEAYVVGGCVRDCLLGMEPKDWDVTTSAPPQEIERVLSGFRIIETGLKHGTVTVLSDGLPVEVTAFRIDGAYSDGRHPDEVRFTRNLREDLARRDFTVNALACGRDGTIVDCFGGRDDLEHKLIRCVGDPDRRFQEDGLRILRALRFSSVLDFSVEPATAESLLKNRSLLDLIAKERIGSEFLRLLCGASAAPVLREFREAVAQFIPEIRESFGFAQNNPHHVFDVWEHTLQTIAAVEPDPVLRLAMFLHDLGKPRCYTEDEKGVGHFYGHAEKSAALAEPILNRLRLDRNTIRDVILLVRWHDIPVAPDETILRRRLNRFGERNLRRLLKLRVADTMAKSLTHREELDKLQEIETILDRILAEGQCFTLKDLAVNGNDLAESGIPTGPETGEILKLLLNAVIEGSCVNRRADLLEYAKHRKEDAKNGDDRTSSEPRI